MNTRIARTTPEFVAHFPATMSPGVLYVSIAYRTCGHLCCCGCGHEVVTPLSPAHWSLTYDGENVTLRPSVGNWGLECQSHYWIRNGQVRWSRRYAPAEIARNRALDRTALSRWSSRAGADRDHPGQARPDDPSRHS